MPVKSFQRLKLQRLSALTLTGLCIAAAQPAWAQSFLGRSAPKLLTVPDSASPSGLPGTARAESETTTASVPPLPQRSFHVSATGLRLSGEESSLQWPVYLTEAQAKEPTRLRIG